MLGGICGAQEEPRRRRAQHGPPFRLLLRERGRAPLQQRCSRPWGSEPSMDLRGTQESRQGYSAQTQEPCLRLTDTLLHAAHLLSDGGTQEAGVFRGPWAESSFPVAAGARLTGEQVTKPSRRQACLQHQQMSAITARKRRRASKGDQETPRKGDRGKAIRLSLSYLRGKHM